MQIKFQVMKWFYKTIWPSQLGAIKTDVFINDLNTKTYNKKFKYVIPIK